MTVAAVAPAGAVTIATGSYANSGMGAEFATPYDTLVIAGAALEVLPTAAPMTISLGEYTFEVGPNCYSCTLTPTFDALIDVTVDGLRVSSTCPTHGAPRAGTTTSRSRRRGRCASTSVRWDW